jgi:hypothetical protein
MNLVALAVGRLRARRQTGSAIEMMWSAAPKAAKTGQGSAEITVSSAFGYSLFT